MQTLQSLEVLNAIQVQRAVHRYRAEPVPRATIEELLEAAVQAPSATNGQPCAFAVVESAGRLKAYSNRAKIVSSPAS